MNEAVNKNVCVSEDLFYSLVKNALKTAKPKQYALVSLDFDNFNFINDLFGFSVGDKVLAYMEQVFEDKMHEDEFFTRAHADHFIFFITVEDECTVASRFEKMANTDVTNAVLPEHYTFVTSGGIVIIDEPSERLTSILDKANFSRKKAKGNHSSTFLYYDIAVKEELDWKKKITLSMQSAMQNREFEMYLQPKIDLKTGVIIGAEALARWNSKAYGLIMPSHFIPVFEQNGFVKILDFFMLNEVCRFLKRWEAEGFAPFPISVNFSRLHVQTPALAQRIFKVVNDNGVAAKYIELELTESVVSSNFQTLINTITELKQLGFSVSLDDFGSAYSSLNLLKDLPLDTIKIDRAFLTSLSGNSKSEVVLKRMIELASDLNMHSLIEGVETQEQVQLMKTLGCNSAQGFFYAKPMDENRFMSYAATIRHNTSTAPLHPQLLQAELTAQKSTWEIHNILQSIDIGVMKTYLDKEGCIQYINDAALSILGYTRSELRVEANDNIEKLITQKSRAILWRNARTIFKTRGSMDFRLVVIKRDGTEIIISGRSSYAQDENKRPMGIYTFRDITEQTAETGFLKQTLREKIQELDATIALNEEKINEYKQIALANNIIHNLADLITFEWDFETDSMAVSENYEALMGRRAVHHNISSSTEILSRFHPDDRACFRQWTNALYKKRGTHSADIRFLTVDGRFLWMRCRGTVIFDANNKPVKAVGMIANVDLQKKEIEFLEQKSQYDSLTHLLNKEELSHRVDEALQKSGTTKAAMVIIDIDNFKGVNDNLGHQFGDNVLRELADEIINLFSGDCLAGRLGGDEFIVFIPETDNLDDTVSRAHKLLNAMRKSYYGENKKYDVTCSAGIAFYPQHSASFDGLYHFADTALYSAKDAGKDCCVIYSPNLQGNSLFSVTPMDKQNNFLDKYFTGDLIYNIFEMLYETKDLKTTVEKILGLVGHNLGVDRAYIFEYSPDKKFLTNTFEWCAPGVRPEIETLQNIPIELYSVFPANFNSDGLHICSDIQTLDKLSHDILAKQGIKAVLQCALHTGGELSGLVGFDDCNHVHEWRGEEIATLGYISRILSVFLHRNHVSKALSKSHENFENMIYNLNGYVYVIDPQTFELLYINKPMEGLGIHVGQKCYEAAFGATQPCKSCPASRLTKQEPKANEDIFSVKLNTWINSAASLLKWTDGMDAALVCCTKIKSAGVKNLI